MLCYVLQFLVQICWEKIPAFNPVALSGRAPGSWHTRGTKMYFYWNKLPFRTPHHCARFFPSTVCHVNACYALTAQDHTCFAVTQQYVMLIHAMLLQHRVWEDTWRVTTSPTILCDLFLASEAPFRQLCMAACQKQQLGWKPQRQAMGKTFETGLFFLEILFFFGQIHVVNYLQQLLVDSFDICHVNMHSYSISQETFGIWMHLEKFCWTTLGGQFWHMSC